MAQMIPERPHPSSNQSERRVFNAFSGCPESWTVFHGLSRAEKTKGKRRVPGGECDFVVCIPNVGWVVVEVKGHGVKYFNYEWVREYRGRRQTLDESPMEQAQQNAFDMQRYLKRTNPELKRCPFFFAVAFPFHDVGGPEISPGNTLAPTDCADPASIQAGINRIVNDTRERTGVRPCSAALISDVIEAFKTKVEVAADMVMLQNELSSLEFSNEQSDAIPRIAFTDKVLVEGPAGTGKTLLAMHIAREAAASGLKTLVLTDTEGQREWMQLETFGSPGLAVDTDAHWLTRRILDVVGPPPVDVAIASIDKTVADLQHRRQQLVDVQNAQEPAAHIPNDNQSRPSNMREALDNVDDAQLRTLNNAFEILNHSDRKLPWDILVWDEFQHFPFPKTAAAIVQHFNRVKIFADFQRQDELGQAVDRDLRTLVLNELSTNPIKLARNYRNSSNIASAVRNLSGFDVGEPRPVDALQVEVHYISMKAFEDEYIASQTVRAALENRIEDLPYALGDVSGRIATILGNQALIRRAFQWESTIYDYPIRRFEGRGLRDAEPLEAHVCISSISEFSGLESPVVLFIEGKNDGITPPINSLAKHTKYAALTRARTLLCIYTPEANRQYYQDRLPQARHIPPDNRQSA